MVVSASAVLLLGALVYLLYRHAGLRVWHALACTLFGFYLASTSAAPHIREASHAVATWLSGLNL